MSDKKHPDVVNAEHSQVRPLALDSISDEGETELPEAAAEESGKKTLKFEADDVAAEVEYWKTAVAWTPEVKLTKEVVEVVSVWIRLHGLGLKFWGKNCLEKLATEVGRFVKCDMFTEQRIHVAYARLLVEVGLNQPMVPEIQFLDETDKMCAVKVEYEWLPVICASCGGFVHKADTCKLKKTQRVWRQKAVQPVCVVAPPSVPPLCLLGGWEIGRFCGDGVSNGGTSSSIWTMGKIGFWNVRGLNSLTKQKEIMWFLHKNKVDLFGLLETKIRSTNINKFAGVIGNNWSFCTNHSCHVGGRIWILWNPLMFQLLHIVVDAQVIHARVKLLCGNVDFWLSMVYGFNGANERRGLWVSFRMMKNNISGPWIWCGDFNCVLGSDERIGLPVQLSEIKDFTECVHDCGMFDIKAIGSFFTWNNKQEGNHRVYSRLDRVMHNGDWGLRFDEAFAQFLPEGLSDHCPCLISLAGEV
ncbi:hypothetical protein RND81_09G090900 [Saponaria officinalis]|uniref:Endonuclease/exonuclease/phosphatase domain-containing protein n=1 Tax=Saponaria officinalis TaxID=3572 RepID=A0AAW1IIJ0_SAPOF